MRVRLYDIDRHIESRLDELYEPEERGQWISSNACSTNDALALKVQEHLVRLEYLFVAVAENAP